MIEGKSDSVHCRIRASLLPHVIKTRKRAVVEGMHRAAAARPQCQSDGGTIFTAKQDYDDRPPGQQREGFSDLRKSDQVAQ